MQRLATILFILCGCGRFGFDGQGDPSAVDGASDSGGAADTGPDAAPPTAPPPGVNLTLPGSSYITIDSLCADMGAGFTIAAWIRPNPVQGGLSYSEIAALNSGDGGANLALVQWITGPANVNYYDDLLGTNVYGSTSAPASQWSHVALTIDAAGNGKLYINGALGQSFSTSATVPSTARFSLGQEWDGTTPTEFFVGDIDEVAVWKSVRTPTELVADMTHPPLSDPDLVAFFDFEAGTVTDATGHGHVATTVGSAAFPTH